MNVTWFDAALLANALTESSGEELGLCYTFSGCSFAPGVRGRSCDVVEFDPACTGYRLPSEAEWEYATRAGTSSRFWSGETVEDLARVAWFGQGDGRNRPAALKAPNPWGLFDTHGNVWEWVHDWADVVALPEGADFLVDPYGPDVPPEGPPAEWGRILRAASAGTSADWNRSASRGFREPGSGIHYVGMRLARTLPCAGDEGACEPAGFVDNCPEVANPSQSDSDGDGIGDACDLCPLAPDPEQGDTDQDEIGDACDDDRDGDGIDNVDDVCPFMADPDQADQDADGVGDVCELDLGRQTIICDGAALEPPCNGCPANTAVPPGWVCIPPGAFMMGSPPEEIGRDVVHEGDGQHPVRLTRPFLVRATEITRGEWSSIMPVDPSCQADCGAIGAERVDDCPVECVSWFDAARFVNRLSTRAGLEPCYVLECDGDSVGDRCQWDAELRAGCSGHRLPTEAEWEYMTRARSRGRFWSSDTLGDILGSLLAVAWFDENSAERLQPVAQRAPNPWGLFDVHGNVREWVHDNFDQYPADDAVVIDPFGPDDARRGRVYRGGGFVDAAAAVRSAARDSIRPVMSWGSLGFRTVRPVIECDVSAGFPRTEICRNGVDDDCDGSVDEQTLVLYEETFSATADTWSVVTLERNELSRLEAAGEGDALIWRPGGERGSGFASWTDESNGYSYARAPRALRAAITGGGTELALSMRFSVFQGLPLQIVLHAGDRWLAHTVATSDFEAALESWRTILVPLRPEVFVDAAGQRPSAEEFDVVLGELRDVLIQLESAIGPAAETTDLDDVRVLMSGSDVDREASYFDESDDGWAAIQLDELSAAAARAPVELVWSPEGGVEGGHVTLVDPSANGGVYFSAPPAATGDRRFVIGGELRFSQRSSQPGDGRPVRVVVIGDGRAIWHLGPPVVDVADVWSPVTIRLLAEEFMIDDDGVERAVDVDEFEAVFGAIEAVLISGEAVGAAGEMTDLDSVRWIHPNCRGVE